jgi:hypothetical protein
MKELTSRALDEERDLNDNDRLIMRFFTAIGEQPDRSIGMMTDLFSNLRMAESQISEAGSHYSADSL